MTGFLGRQPPTPTPTSSPFIESGILWVGQKILLLLNRRAMSGIKYNEDCVLAFGIELSFIACRLAM